VARRRFQFVQDRFYHVYNRGNNRARIFFEEENYRFFLRRVYSLFSAAGIDLVCFCLMPNHYHLVVRLSRGINFSNVMRSLSVSYTKSLNVWRNQVGHVFQGDYRAIHVDEDSHLSHLVRYVHLNPVKARLVAAPEQWKFSDYRDWISEIEDGTTVRARLRSSLFGSAEAYRAFVVGYKQKGGDISEFDEIEK